MSDTGAYLSGRQIAAILRRYRFPLGHETRLQEEIASVLRTHGVPFEREVVLSAKDRIDFLCAEVTGIEAKLFSGKLDLFRQCQRYCTHDRIRELVLVTNVPVGWPEAIGGRPQFVVNLAKAWAR